MKSEETTSSKFVEEINSRLRGNESLVGWKDCRKGEVSRRILLLTRLHKLTLRLELYLPYAPLPGGGGILPAVSGSGASGGCRPVLLGGVDLSMSAAVQPPVATLPTSLTSSGPIAAHNSLHHTSGGLALPLGAAAGPPVMMPRPPPGAMPPLGPTLPSTHQDEDLADAAPNQDVLLALLARNKNLEGE